MSGLRQRFLLFFATFLVVAIFTHSLCAELIPLAHYSLGEEDPNSDEGNQVTLATDNIAFGGTPRDMTRTGDVIYAGFTAPGIDSSSSVLLAGGYLSTDATPWHSLYDGFRVGMEAWINVDEIGEEMVPFGNSNAYFFSIDADGFFHANAGGNSTEPTQAQVTPGEWQHVAFWTTGSFWQVYVDGEAQLDPPGNFTYGGPAGLATIGADQNGDQLFSGFMDEMRVFRWTGAFDPGELLYFTQRLDGDVNEDGIVNTDDYDIWRMNVGADLSELTLIEGRGLGDVDVNGVIDLDDFSVIKENRTPGAAFVPEPSSLVTALLALFGWIGFCHRRPATLR